MAARKTVAENLAEVAETVGHLGIPVHVTTESGPYGPGINVWRMTRTDQPSRSHPYRGIFVSVMYDPQTASEARAVRWVARVRAALTSAYPDRLRSLPGDSVGMLIEDPDTAYSAWRAAENAKRARLGFKPLHKVGQ